MRGWNGVRERLRRDGGPSSRSDVWQRVEASRAGGATIELPRERPRTLARVGLYGALALALFLAFIPSGRNPPPPIPAAPALDWSWPFLPEAALAQAAYAPHLPAIGSPDGSRLSPGRWVYVWAPTRESPSGAFPIMDTVTVRRGTFRDESVWLVTRRIHRASGHGTGRLDSLYLNLSNLRPLRHALVVPGALDQVRRAGSMDFERDSLRWQFMVPGSGMPGLGRDTVVTAVLPADYATVGQGLSLLLIGIRFAKNWAGAVPMLLPSIDWSGHDSPVQVLWIDLRVTGREQVTVPAGTFDCWRISETIPGSEDPKTINEVWVDSRSGVVVKEAPGGVSISPRGRELAAILP